MKKSDSTKKRSRRAAPIETLEIESGHQPADHLKPQDEALFRAFQSNLLSLISHELRTPLTGIMNALGALEYGAVLEGLTSEDLVKMARENALRLHQALTTLLDLASLDSGGMHVRMREVELSRIIRARINSVQPLIDSRKLKLNIADDYESHACLGDPSKLGRAIDLCLQVVVPRAEEGGTVRIKTSSRGISFVFELARKMEKLWESSWAHSEVGFHSGVASPYSAFGTAFGGVLQSEKAFLSRVEDGFGSEFLLIHEIMRLHHGRFSAVLNDRVAELTLELPELSTEESLKRVLKSRAFQVSSELGAVTLIRIQAPENLDLILFREQVRANLYRTTDGVYPLPSPGQLALVLDDCKLADAPRIMSRICRAVGLDLHYGVAHCPTDSLDPEELIPLSEERLKAALSSGPSGHPKRNKAA